MKNIMFKFTVGIKIKKKKKFRKWQKNSGAIFEKGGAIMGWGDILKNNEEEVRQRSETFLREFAETLGKEITIGEINSPTGGFGGDEWTPVIGASFKHEGMNVSVMEGGILLNKHVFVCVVNRKNLPLFDTLAAMMGLVVVSPSQIPTVELGIKIAKIFNFPDGDIEVFRIFTPFGFRPSENYDFRTFFRSAHMDVIWPGKKKEIIEAIIEVFDEGVMERILPGFRGVI